MLNNKRNDILLALCGIIPVSVSMQMIEGWEWASWLMYAIPFCPFIKAASGEAFKLGFIAGTIGGIVNFCWILSASGEFTGNAAVYGIAVVAVLSIIVGAYLGFLGWVFTKIRWRNSSHAYDYLLNAMTLSCFWVLCDAFIIYIADGFSLCLFVTYIPFTRNLYAIQPASVLGPLVITFVIIFVNYLAAHFVVYRRWKMLGIPAGMLGLYLLIGYFMLTIDRNSTHKPNSTPSSFKAAIISENLLPQYKWDSINGNKIVEAMFALNRQVAASGAQLAVWSESAVPWNYTPDDEFLSVIDKITTPAGVTHLIGMNTDYIAEGRIFYNSVYCMLPGRKVTGRYDKRVALSLIEKPFCGLILPFYNSSGFRVQEGDSHAPLHTPYGNAGILLCNESSVPEPAYRSVLKGAQFLVNPGNDGWFTNTYITRQHFYHARLRAVETRKDIIINNNNGYSGLIKASGEIALKEKAEDAYVAVVDVEPNGITTIAVKYPYLLIIFCAIAFLTLLIHNYSGFFSHRIRG